ncbi:HAD family hydrolase [Haladaptatus sp. DJG-WS-42]|uniref:HAD family hydrolase n=1 Tax=Haladaptatus sp. DJG-WS-42 TaxID=3120516 RepID=UPI0030CC8C56
MRYDAVIFDNDGVLVEPPNRTTVRRVAEATFHSFDLRRPTQDDLRQLGAHNLETIRQLAQQYDITPVRFCGKMTDFIESEQQREFRQGVRSLYEDVTALFDLDLPLGIVSDNPPKVLSYILRFFGLEAYFSTVYGCPFTPEGLSRRKPSPYYLNAALSDLDTQNAVYIGDQPCDVAAAENAGIDSALLTRDDTPVDWDVAPTYQIASLSELPALIA